MEKSKCVGMSVCLFDRLPIPSLHAALLIEVSFCIKINFHVIFATAVLFFKKMRKTTDEH